MQTYIITVKGRTRSTDTWQEVYEILCDMLHVEPVGISEERHMDFANAESWCELLCTEDAVYQGNGFTIRVEEDFDEE